MRSGTGAGSAYDAQDVDKSSYSREALKKQSSWLDERSTLI